MTTTDPFFALPRTTRPADWFERILPGLPLQLPATTLAHAVAYHVHGAGGGTWTVGLRDGRLVTTAGMAPNVAAQLSMSAAHLREALTGALRDRLKAVLVKQGRAVTLPPVSRLPEDALVAAVAALGGSIAFEIGDREYDDTYRFVLTLGNGPAAFERATTTIQVDADDLVGLAGARTPPWQILVSGKLRIQGDAGLPTRVLSTLMGKAA